MSENKEQVEKFRTKTALEVLHRSHALTTKVMAGIVLAMVLVSGMFAGTVCYMFSKLISVETAETQSVNQGANTSGDNSPVNQTAGK